MANTLLPRDLPAAGTVNTSSAIIIDDGSGVKKATPAEVVASGFPVASQSEAEAGTVSDKAMTPQRVKQAIDALGVSQTVLASSSGAAGVGLFQGGKVQDAIKYVTPEMFGAVGDGTTDDSSAVQDAIDYLTTGGKLLCSASYLVGGITIDTQDVIVEGLSRNAKFIVKDGTTGFTVSKDWVHFRHLGIESEGTEGDGLGTNGILYTKGSGSIGHVYNYDLNVENFSGVGVEFRNALDLTMISCFHKSCKTGLKFGRNGTSGSDFSTTIQLINCYAIACDDYGIDGAYVYRSTFNVIAEYCGIGIRNNIGDLTLNRCYFENNTTLGAQLTDTVGQDVNNYSNNSTTDAVTRTRSVIANTDWYTARQDKGDFWSRRVGLQTAWGRDTRFFAGVGTTDNIGVKYNEGIVPVVYGDDLIDSEAWTSETTSEFVGWDVTNSGYKIATALTGVRGMRQSVSLDSTKTYVVQFLNKNVAGNAISTVQVDGTTRTPGIPFTVSSTGSKVVRCYASQSVTSENYVQVFRLMEVLEDQKQIAKTTDRLLRAPGQRAERYASAAPSSGYHAVGERVWNNAPTAGGTMGWVCTTAGNPGTWKTFGTIAA